MAEPVIAPAVITLTASGVMVPVLAFAGTTLGLRVDVLIAGFVGAMAAIALLDSVPRTSDTLRELLTSTGKRLGVALASAGLAGYLAPLAGLLLQGLLPATAAASLPMLERAAAFLLGGGAQRIFKALINRSVRQAEGA